MPTLSSLYFKTKKSVGVDKSRKHLVVERHEDQLPYLRIPLSMAFKDALRSVIKFGVDTCDSTSSNSSESDQISENLNEKDNEPIF